jgi:hypothetical protein
MALWQPFHGNHAIDVMAAVVTFAQRVPDEALRPMLSAAEDAAFPAGLTSRHSVQMAQAIAGPQGRSASGPAGDIQGLCFNAVFAEEDGTPTPSRIAEQLHVDANSVAYRTWRYVSWSWQMERLRSLMAPVLVQVRDVASVASVRLEYRDRFWFEGEPQEAITSDLLRVDSTHLAPHLFERQGLWQLHTEAFLPPDPVQRLEQVLVDAREEPAPGKRAAPAKRWICITTALEDRFLASASDAMLPDPRDCGEFPFDLLDGLHSDLKVLLGSIITGSIANRICLTD